MQEAINSLASVLNIYLDAISLNVVSQDILILKWLDKKALKPELKEETFGSAIEWLEWMENNLETK